MRRGINCLCLLLFSISAQAVDCIPELITLSSQVEVDNFQANHGPGCDTIVTGLTIEGASINDLTPLIGLTTVSTVGPFGLDHRFRLNNTSVTSLAGLDNLANVHWIEFNDNTLLTDITALSNLTTVRGPLIITGNTALTNLSGLQGLTALTGGALSLENNTLLSDLSGISNIVSIGASLRIRNNDALLNLDAFSGLGQVASNINISYNDQLANLGGLGGLAGFDASLDVRYNNQLSSLGNLHNITQLGGLILWSNPLLTNLDGLENLTTLGNQTALSVRFNYTLTSIAALSNLVGAGFDVEFSDNYELSDCSALQTLLDGVDDADPGPGPGVAGIPDVGGDVIIENNAEGCNSIDEIVVTETPPGILLYGDLVTGQEQILLKGRIISQSCLESPVDLPNGEQVLTSRILFACSSVDYYDTDTLVYDVAQNKCQSFSDFEATTGLDIHASYFRDSSAAGPLRQISDVLFNYEPQALLLFDPSTGDVLEGGLMFCPDAGSVSPPPPSGVLEQLAFLKAHNAGVDDSFGDKVAVSGNTVVVGAKEEDGSATTVNGPDDDAAAGAGAAYVFVYDSVADAWVQQAYLKASNGGAGDKFGADVAIDGDIIVVGAENEDGAGSNSGAAYVFVRSDGQWTEQAILRPSNAAAGDWFGGDVAISGTTIVVGAYREDEAFVFIYDALLDAWTEQQILTGSNTEAGDSFGRGVAINGDTIVVGAFFEDSDATSINGAEDNNNRSNSGAAYVFVRNAGVWTQQAYIKADNAAVDDGFGGALSLSGDTLAAGVFHRGSNDQGGAYVFQRSGETWTQQAYVEPVSPGINEYFGSAISVSGDLLAVGSPHEDGNGIDGETDNSLADSGAVYVFKREAGAWSQHAYLKASNAGAGDWFGRDVGISGNTVTGGAFYEDSSVPGDGLDDLTANSGAAYVFNVPLVIDPNPGDITPPNVTPPPDLLALEATGVFTPVNLGMATVTDDSGETLVATVSFAGPFQLGDTTVTWSATDSAGNTGIAQQLVNVVDTTDPQLTAPADINRAANGGLSKVYLGSAIASDSAGPLASLVNDAPNLFPVGVTVVTWTATDLSGNQASDQQTVTLTPPEVEASYAGSSPPVIDGFLSYGEWKNATRFNLENGFMKFTHDRERLYVLIDVLEDDTDDAFGNGGGDQFWLHFDIDEDGSVTPDVDLRYRLSSGTGNMRLQTACDGCLGGFNALQSTFSARGEGFGCFIEDNSLSFLPLRCNNHRVWELALDLAELDMRADLSTRFGFLVASGTPLISENYPNDLGSLAEYVWLTLQNSVRQQSTTGPGFMNPQHEITQGIQTTANDLELVAGKPAVVRIWDVSNNGNLVKNFIYGTRNGVDLPGSPLLDVNTLYSDYGPADPRDTIAWNSTTVLPKSWSEGGMVNFSITVQGLDDSIVSVDNTVTDFVNTRQPVFWTVPIRNNFPDNTFTLAQGSQIDSLEQLLLRSAPVQDIAFVRRPVISVNNITTSSGLKQVLKTYDQFTILAWSLGLAQNGVPPFDLPEQITGFNATGFLGVGGSSDRVGKGGDGRISWVGLTSTAMTYGHEINHNIDRAATSTWGLHSRGCNAQSGGPLDPNWPYGSDWTIQETGVSQSTAGSFKSVNDQTPDLMSYCLASGTPRLWWTPYRWQAWIDEFKNATPGGAAPVQSSLSRTGVPAISEPADLPVPEESFYVLGRVFQDGNGEISQVLRQAGVPDPEGLTGNYSVRVTDCADLALAENSFPVDFLGDEGEYDAYVTFGFILPAAAASCHIELLLDGVVLDSRTISSNAPSVTVTSPNGGENWEGVHTVQWAADDPDSDPLQFTLLYSPDNGLTWEVIATMVDALEYDVDFSALRGSDAALIRVLATDGGNTGEDDADDTFMVTGRPTEVQILTPRNGDFFPSGQPISLNGLARDAYGEPWPESGLLWSTTDGVVGSGSSLQISLDEGVHPIALIAMDGQTIAGLKVIEITVSDTPGEISFDASAYQTDELNGDIVLRVVRTGSSAGPAAVLFHTQDGSAVSGGDPALGEDDYDAVADQFVNRLEWGDGETGERFISIGINQDDVQEGPETFNVMLTPVDGESLGISNATVIIGAELSEVIFKNGFE